MKTFNKCAAQGDVLFMRVDSLPQGLKEVSSTNNVRSIIIGADGKDMQRACGSVFILAHSETGHNHVMEARPNVKLFSTDNPLVSYLQIVEATEEAENFVEHLRSFDTHEPISFNSGIYKVINQRESAPEGWRRAAD
jgi:RAB protein geranylgeranyltransferase component A